MSYKDREEQILQLVKEKEYISVKELTKLLYVSEPTIRRDLALLERQGFLMRNRGGALYIGQQQAQLPLAFRHDENTREKKYIARLAKEFIQPGSHVFMDASSSCFYLAQEIDKNTSFHALTNGISTADILAKSPNIQVEIACGQYNAYNRAIQGSQTCEYIQNHYADVYFMSTNGLDIEYGLSSPTMEDAKTANIYHQQSKKTILLVDHTKLNKKYYAKILDMSKIDILITDQPLPLKFDNYCYEHDIEVIYE